MKRAAISPLIVSASLLLFILASCTATVIDETTVNVTPSSFEVPDAELPTPLAPEAGDPITFIQTQGGGRRDRGINVLQTSDGGYAVVGYSSSGNAVGEDVYLVRLDPQGELLWSSTYGGEGNDNGWDLLEREGGGFIVVGFTDSFGAGGMDIYLFETDAMGDLLWERTYGGPEDEFGWSMAATTDGGYVLGGQSESFGEGDRDGYLVRVDPQGEEIWSQTFGGPEEDRLFSVDATADSGFILTGTTRGFGAVERDLFLVKTNEDGELDWMQVFGGDRDDVGHSVRRTADDGYMVTGYTRSFDAANYDTWMIKLDMTGEVEWEQFFGGSGDDRAIFGDQTEDGGYILTGYSRSFGAIDWDVLLVRADATGEILWHRTFGGVSEDTGYTVRQTSDAGFIVTGETYSLGAGRGDMYIIKVDQEGSIVE